VAGGGQGDRRDRHHRAGRALLLRPALRWIARSATPEIFTAAALLLVVATAALMQAVGLSMALGAFLAGVLLAESEYRRELETDIEPFKGLLLGLFFIAVGMSIDFAVVLQQPLLIAAIVLGFFALKAAVLWGMGRAMPLPKPERPVFIILLAQGGEFGFVVFQTATQANVIDAPTSSLLVAAVAVSMLLTPLLLVAADKWWIPLLAKHKPVQRPTRSASRSNAPVIIAGFGRYGQIVGRLMFANGISATVLEHDAEQVESLRKFGWPRLLRRRDAARPAAHGRCGQGRRDRAGHRRRGAEPEARRRGERKLPAADHRCARAQRDALLRPA
jgi:glutathione-regulated potassium-efflux system ancillary protein KefC